MESKRLLDEDADVQVLPAVDLQDRLSAGPVGETSRVSARVEGQERRRPGLSAPAWALIGALTLFTIAAIVKLGVHPPTSTTEQITKLLDPRFKPAAVDPEGEAAFRKFLQIGSNLSKKDVSALGKEGRNLVTGQPVDWSGVSAFAGQPASKQIVAALEAPKLTANYTGGTQYSNISTCVIALDLLAQWHLQNGNESAAERELKALFNLYPKMESSHSANAYLGYLGAGRSLSAARELRFAKMDPERMQRLLDSMRPPERFHAEEQAIRQLISEEMVQDIVDPARRRMAVGGGYGDFGERYDDVSANFDPVATAKTIQRIALPSLENLRKPWAAGDTRANRLYHSEIDTVNFDRPNEGNWWDTFFYRRSRDSNLVGKALIKAHGSLALDYYNEAFYHLAMYEAARTMLGIAVYEKRHGRPPQSLQQLVDEGIFKTLPTDPFSQKPLKYRLKPTRMIYSVGPNGMDEKGLKLEGLDRNRPGDIAYSLDYPPPPKGGK